MTPERKTVAMAFGKVLRQARRDRKISQEALAKSAAFDRTYPSLLEHGLRCPTLEAFMDLSKALDMKPQKLFAAFLDELPP